jgi:hypothetical protein
MYDRSFLAPHKTHWRLNQRIRQLAKAKTRTERKRRKRQIQGLRLWLASIEQANSNPILNLT